LVTGIDAGVAALVAELRGHEQQAAAELEQWKTHHEERWLIDASPAAITLALLLTDEELDSLEKRAGGGEIAEPGRSGGSDVASPQPAAHLVSLPKYSPPMPRPPTGDRGWMADGVITLAMLMTTAELEELEKSAGAGAEKKALESSA
jgi:hypothetical protein